MSKKESPENIKGGSWTSAQWYSDERIDAAPRYWSPGGDLPKTHLAYITAEEADLLKKQAKDNNLVIHDGPKGIPFLAPESVEFSVDDTDGDVAEKVPARWKSSEDHPMAYLVYVTDEQAQFLKKMDIHGSGVDKHDHYGPDNVPSYQGDGGGGGGGDSNGGGDSGGGGGDSGGGGGDSGGGGDTSPSGMSESQAAAYGAPSVSATDFAESVSAAPTSLGMTESQAQAYGASPLSSTDFVDSSNYAPAQLGPSQYGAPTMSATDFDDAYFSSLANRDANLVQIGQSEQDAIAYAEMMEALGALSSSAVGKSEQQAIKDAEAYAQSRGFSLSNLSPRDLLSFVSMARMGPIGVVIGGLQLAAKASQNPGMARAAQAAGVVNSLASNNPIGALSGLLSMSGALNAPFGSRGATTTASGGTSPAPSAVSVSAPTFDGTVPSTSYSASESIPVEAVTSPSAFSSSGGASSRSSSVMDSILGSGILGGALSTGSSFVPSQNEPTRGYIGGSTDLPSQFQGPLHDFFKSTEEGYYTPPKSAPVNQSAPVIDRLDMVQPVSSNMANYFNYGEQTDIDKLLTQSSDFLGFKSGGMATPLMASGGAPGVVNHSGKARLDFRQGAAVNGPGDGQSDDIPAMLADGEFVFPADVVSALGNGSTKAGSDKLYEMMHSIRAYHRSAKPKDLPPPAKKSPLDYIKPRKTNARKDRR